MFASDMDFVINHSPDTGLIAQFVDLQFSTVPFVTVTLYNDLTKASHQTMFLPKKMKFAEYFSRFPLLFKVLTDYDEIHSYCFHFTTHIDQILPNMFGYVAVLRASSIMARVCRCGTGPNT